MNDAPRATSGRPTDAVDPRMSEQAELVGHLVRETMCRVPSSVTEEELTGPATAALAEAARSHVSEDGDFARYATARIRVAIAEHLQAIDWSARTPRRRAAGRDGALAALAASVQALPLPDRTVIEGYFLHQQPIAEIAESLGMSAAEVEQTRTSALMALRPLATASA